MSGRPTRLRPAAMSLAYFNVAFNLLLYAGNPRPSSLVVAGIWMVSALALTGLVISARHRRQAAMRDHPVLMPAQPILPDPFRWAGPNTIVLGPGESVIPIPRAARKPCSHWPRDEVKLNDGSVAAYICRACGHDWANEDWVRS